MNEENSSEKKLEEITGASNLSAAIKKLEEKKQSIKDGLKVHAQNMARNLSPVKVLDQTLENVKQSSSQDSLFNEALAFGAGYLSKRKLIHQFKNAIIKTFRKAMAAENPAESREVQEEVKYMNYKSETGNLPAAVEKVKAKPEILPKPTYWPFFLALGIVFLGWGLLTTWLISLAGLIILITALTGWLNILRHE